MIAAATFLSIQSFRRKREGKITNKTKKLFSFLYYVVTNVIVESFSPEKFTVNVQNTDLALR